MSFKPQIENDELAMYAMGLLAPPEASVIAGAVAASEELRQRLAMVQEILALYGEAAVELEPAPEGSLERLRVVLGNHGTRPQPAPPQELAAAPPLALMPEPVTQAEAAAALRHSRIAETLAWIGWAVAAVLLVTAGKLYHDRSMLDAMVAAQMAQTRRISKEAVELDHERDALQADVVEQAHRIQQMSARGASARSTTEMLQSAIASQSTQLAAQDHQVAQLSSDAATARQILVALTGESALRLPLTRPKSHSVPLAQAAYVASRKTLVFLASNLQPLKANKVYQLWLMPANGASPVPAGTFAPDAHGEATLFYTDFPAAVAAKGFSVTIENSGGAQTPTLPIILASSSPA